jgi:hypothetical protein
MGAFEKGEFFWGYEGTNPPLLPAFLGATIPPVNFNFPSSSSSSRIFWNRHVGTCLQCYVHTQKHMNQR